jgi:hypothetical protein
MKTAVYSWRLSIDLKTQLEEQARSEGKSVSELLEEVASSALQVRRTNNADEDARQAAIRRRVMEAVGSIRGDDPTRSARTSELVSEIIRRKHEKESRASLKRARRTH